MVIRGRLSFIAAVRESARTASEIHRLNRLFSRFVAGYACLYFVGGAVCIMIFSHGRRRGVEEVRKGVLMILYGTEIVSTLGE